MSIYSVKGGKAIGKLEVRLGGMSEWCISEWISDVLEYFACLATHSLSFTRLNRDGTGIKTVKTHYDEMLGKYSRVSYSSMVKFKNILSIFKPP